MFLEDFSVIFAAINLVSAKTLNITGYPAG